MIFIKNIPEMITVFKIMNRMTASTTRGLTGIHFTWGLD